jgi:curved DNA-binding protein CbpA
MQRVPDPYRVLGVGREATPAEVKAAHRRLAKRYHPDAPNADAARFLAAQDAYELLRDPLRRRDWDRKHATGPVRAEPATTSGRRRRATDAAPAGDPADPTRPPKTRRRATHGGSDATFGPNDRPPHADTWTWTAEGVPWWEDGGSPKGRRSSRRRSAAAPAESARAAAAARRRTPPAADAEPTPGSRNDSDVYARSSGAAWSSASRAYFRRRSAEMPSGAANPNTPRWTTPVGAPMPRRYGPSAAAETEHQTAAEETDGAARGLGSTLSAIFRRGGR